MDLDLVLALPNDGALVEQGWLVCVEAVSFVLHVLALTVLNFLADLLGYGGNEFRAKS